MTTAEYIVKWDSEIRKLSLEESKQSTRADRLCVVVAKTYLILLQQHLITTNISGNAASNGHLMLVYSCASGAFTKQVWIRNAVVAGSDLDEWWEFRKSVSDRYKDINNDPVRYLVQARARFFDVADSSIKDAEVLTLGERLLRDSILQGRSGKFGVDADGLRVYPETFRQVDPSI